MRHTVTKFLQFFDSSTADMVQFFPRTYFFIVSALGLMVIFIVCILSPLLLDIALYCLLHYSVEGYWPLSIPTPKGLAASLLHLIFNIATALLSIRWIKRTWEISRKHQQTH